MLVVRMSLDFQFLLQAACLGALLLEGACLGALSAMSNLNNFKPTSSWLGVDVVSWNGAWRRGVGMIKIRVMRSKQQTKEWFWGVVDRKQQEGLKMGKELVELFSFLEDSIRRDFETFNLLSFTICGTGKRNFNLVPELETALLACSTSERIAYLEITVQHLITRKLQTSIKVLEGDFSLEEVRVRLLKGIKMKESARILLKELTLDCKHFQIDLSSYLLRISKKDSATYILETMTCQQPPSIRFALENPSPTNQQELTKMKSLIFQTVVESALQKGQASPEIKLSKGREKPVQPSSRKLTLQVETEDQVSGDKRSLIEELVGNQIEGNLNQEMYDYMERREEQSKRESVPSVPASKLHPNRVPVLLGNVYNIAELDSYFDFTLQPTQSKELVIYYSRSREVFRLEMRLACSRDEVALHLAEAQLEKLWNRSINESQIRWNISTENSAIVYRKQKTDSEWFKERDFLLLRHLFVMGESTFIVDRSIEHPYFIPFQSIHRAQIPFAVCRLDAVQQGTRLQIDFKPQYGGLLTATHKKSMALQYLKEFSQLENFIRTFTGSVTHCFHLDWRAESITQEITNNQSVASISSQIFMEQIEPILDLHPHDEDEESFYTIVEESMVHEVTGAEDISERKRGPWGHQKEELKFDAEGLVLLPKEYLAVEHMREPTSMRGKRREQDYESVLLKKDFVLDKEGGIVLVNEAKIAAQNNVIKFIMSTLKKNLFSGKGILNVSLPVEIFNVDSNLQRLCESMALAPDFLEEAAKQTDLQRFKNCLSFAFSNSILYFDIDKPFNPILGETYQGIIDGCPVYAEQISHHPPISSILLLGRGYRVYANLEAKVYVHLNSGEGVNEGLYTIEFDDGEKVFFQTAPGEVSGLAVGDRKYRIKGKMIVVSPRSRLCSVVNFEDDSGFFSSKKWAYSDQMEGYICRISQGFIRRFFTREKEKEVQGPGKKEVEETLGQVRGRWTKSMLIDGLITYDVNTVPFELVHYQFPLNSNSNYREDLAYRQINNLARSQQEKERLEIIQRNDRKLREKLSFSQK